MKLGASQSGEIVGEESSRVSAACGVNSVADADPDVCAAALAMFPAIHIEKHTMSPSFFTETLYAAGRRSPRC